MKGMIPRAQKCRLLFHRSSATFLFALIFSLLALAACSGGAPSPTTTAVPTETLRPTATATAVPTSTPTPVPTPTPTPVSQAPTVNLPEDEGAHLTPIEWWYFNGHLSDDAGREYSYHFVTFQAVLPSGLTPRLAQLSWADHDAGLYLTAERPDLPVAKSTAGYFDFLVSTWRMRGDGADYAFAFDVGNYSLELKASSEKPPALHQGTGQVILGHAGNSYYYSRTRLDTTGTMTVDGEERAVAGIAWMDHQWGDFNTAPVGWDWLSLQLDDGSELMVSAVWDSTSHSPIITYGSYIPPDSPAAHLNDDDIALTSTGSWTSEATGTVYPMGWRLVINSLALVLALTPVQQDAEFAGSKFVPPAYWEGAVVAEGTKGAQTVTGKGFLELVGYDTRKFEYPNLGLGKP